MICFKQRVDHGNFFFPGNSRDESLIDFANVPVAGDGIACGCDIIKAAIRDGRALNETVADGIDIVAMINIGKIIYFLNRRFAKCIYNGGAFIFSFSCNVVNEATGKKKIVFLFFLPPLQIQM